MRGASAPALGSPDYIRRYAAVFARAREPRAPKSPETIPDAMVSVILTSFFDLQEADIPRIQHEHRLSMAAENLVGELLERYLASVLEPVGWVWCSGSMVKAVDFIKPPENTTGEWELLQVKNRDNSENSSSSAIRLGTRIKKWHRTFSRKPGSNWAAFPDEHLCKRLSEENFAAFVQNYLQDLR